MSKKKERAKRRAEDKIKSDARAKEKAEWARKCKLITPVMKKMNKTKLNVPTFKQIQSFLKQKFKLNQEEANKISVS